ncbi:MAG: serine/threonine-protein phosphatase [Oscillospiraceae bacterium]|nr:serine/threonine-protein phosphatase [Oscillospiraceae bacterium]
MERETLRLEGSVSSHLGYKRRNNEDNFLLQGEMNAESAPVVETAPKLSPTLGGWHCFAVFDGMGGGERGEVASWLAAKEFQKLSADAGLGPGGVTGLARGAFRAANRRILQEQDRAMYGTTGTAVFTDGQRFRVFHMGDSRAYLYRFGALFQLTQDQTVAAMKIDIGYYSADDPRALRERHQLTEYIGCDPTLEELAPQESEWLQLLPGDRLLLCTDGLSELCSDTEIRETLRDFPDPIGASWKLTERALRAGGRDNVTCMVIGRMR